MLETYEAGVIRKTSGNPVRDANIKALFKLKIIIAHIIHGLIPELNGISCEELAEKYIEVPEDALTAPVSPYGSGAEIHGIRNESGVPGEGSVVFDVVFWVKLPNRTPQRYCLFIDLEGQGKLNPGYSLPKRAEYYSARLISRQLDSLADSKNYDKLQKVYSIWICYNDVPKAARGSITEIKFQQNCLYGDLRFPEEETDLISVIFLVLGNEKLGNETLDFLWTLLRPSCTAEERLKELENDYGIPMNEELMEGVRNMSGILNYHEEFGKKQGIMEGREEGRKEGRKEGREQGIKQGRKEGREQGIKQGRKEGREQGIKQGILAVRDVLTSEELARRFNVSVAYVEGLLAENSVKAKESAEPCVF